MAQEFDGPVKINGTLTVVGVQGTHPNSFEVEGPTAQFANISAFGGIKALADVTSQDVNCGAVHCSTLVPLSLNTITVPGGFACNGNIALTAGDVIVLGHPLLAGLQAVEQKVTGLQNQVNGLINQLNSLQNQVSTLQNQANTANSNFNGRLSVAEVEISDLKARVVALGGG